MTSAEFVPAGFSAVAAFFGAKESEPPSNVAPSVATSKPRGGRQGVGAATPIKSNSSSSSYSNAINLSKKLLKVGKRKRFEDEEENQPDLETDEEEEGRTGIASSNATKAPPPLEQNVVVDEKPKKKKKGKKERQVAATTDVTTMHGSAQVPKGEIDHSATTNPTTSTTGDDIDAPSKKQKRKKIRSRQKNIYKDRRPVQAKPVHLRVGRPDFQGRPLTAATRDKLNLPPSKTVMHRESQQHPNKEAMMTTTTADGGGMKLGIDEFMGDDLGQADEGNVRRMQPIKNNTKANKGKRRPKYKNLAD